MRIGVDDRFPRRGDVSAWWGPAKIQTPEGLRAEQREAEIVVRSGRSVLLVGEAKWSDGEVDLDALSQLRTTAPVIPGVSTTTTLALFARESFSDRLRAAAEAESIILVTAAEMLAAAEPPA